MEKGKQQILNKAEELFMRYGIKSVTMDDIARELGISKKTIYQYVENKGELINQIFFLKAEEEKQLIRKIREEAGDAIEEILMIARFVIRHLRELSPTTMYDLHKYYRTTWKQMESVKKKHVFRVILENIERGVKQGIYRSDLDADLIAKLYVGTIGLLTEGDSFPIGGGQSLDQLYRQFTLYHIHGIASPDGLDLLDKHLADDFGELN